MTDIINRGDNTKIFRLPFLETTMELFAFANNLMEIYLTSQEAWPKSAFNSQEDCFIHFICSYYPGTCAKLTVSKWRLRMHKKKKNNM